jgi:transposase-like protein
VVPARRHDVHSNLVQAWRRQAKTGELSVAPDGEARITPVAVTTEGSAAVPTRDGDDGGSIIEVVLRNGRVLRLSDRMAAGRALLPASFPLSDLTRDNVGRSGQ